MGKYYMRKNPFLIRGEKRKGERDSVFLLIKCDLSKELEQTGHLPHIY